MALINTIEITSSISNAESLNVKIRANITYQNTKDDFEREDGSYLSYTKQLDLIAYERKDLLSSAIMPADGLSFDDGGLLYNSIPLDQASDGEKLKVSLGISMALNPTLKILRIKDGSLLDSKNREIIRSMVKDKEYQLWFESVGSDSSVGILIEEGEIVAVDGKKIKKKEKKGSVNLGTNKIIDMNKVQTMEERGFKVITTGPIVYDPTIVSFGDTIPDDNDW